MATQTEHSPNQARTVLRQHHDDTRHNR